MTLKCLNCFSSTQISVLTIASIVVRNTFWCPPSTSPIVFSLAARKYALLPSCDLCRHGNRWCQIKRDYRGSPAVLYHPRAMPYLPDTHGLLARTSIPAPAETSRLNGLALSRGEKTCGCDFLDQLRTRRMWVLFRFALMFLLRRENVTYWIVG